MSGKSLLEVVENFGGTKIRYFIVCSNGPERTKLMSNCFRKDAVEEVEHSSVSLDDIGNYSLDVTEQFNTGRISYFVVCSNLSEMGVLHSDRLRDPKVVLVDIV